MNLNSQLLTNEKITVALSGGVDSSVAALLLQRQGYEVAALYMKNWAEDDSHGYCSDAIDVGDALEVCDRLGIPLNTVNLTRQYWEHVFQDFLAGYRAGRTPNPDVLCNREIKFRAFVDCARAQGAERVATGHYARIDYRDGRYRLLRGRDKLKDQSYFLYALNQRQLAHACFPLGDLTKTEVRRLAADAGLVTHDKRDSTGICFVGERPFREFLGRYLPGQRGHIRTLDGRVVGSHPGALFFTLGQRKGLGIGGLSDAQASPWYVVDKDLASNTVYVAQGHDHPRLMSRFLRAVELHWIGGAAPPQPLECSAKTRYRQRDQSCIVHVDATGEGRVEFRAPQRAVTPGQSVVFYLGDECLGGGVIDSTTG